MPNLILRENNSLSSPGTTVKGSPLSNNEVDNNFSNLNIAIGVPSNLVTSNTSNLVVAINELNTKINVLNSNIGVLNNLTTSANSNVVSAINEGSGSSGVTPATYGNASIIPIIVVNSQGRITSASNVTINGVSNFANTGPGNVGFTISTVTGASFSANLSTSGVTGGVYGGNSFLSPTITVDSFGRITSASNTTIGIGVSNDTSSNSTTFYPLLSSDATGIVYKANVSSTKLYFNPNSGTLYVTTLTQLSDEQVKTNIINITDATTKIISLNAIEFNWVENGIKSSGFIAQDIEAIFPHLVSTSDLGIKSINYAGIIPYLVRTIFELNERVTSLEKL